VSISRTTNRLKAEIKLQCPSRQDRIVGNAAYVVNPQSTTLQWGVCRVSTAYRAETET
jgi:hypothetical protein